MSETLKTTRECITPIYLIYFKKMQLWSNMSLFFSIIIVSSQNRTHNNGKKVGPPGPQRSLSFKQVSSLHIVVLYWINLFFRLVLTLFLRKMNGILGVCHYE